jgi:hypothetical protein
MMDWIALVLALIGAGLGVLHRSMISKIYQADGRAISAFTLPRIIRREYSLRFGKDKLFWASRFLPVLFLVVAVIALITALTKTR